MKLFKSKTHPANWKNKTWRKLVFGFFVLFFSISFLFILRNTAFAQTTSDMDPGSYIENATSINNYSYEDTQKALGAAQNGFKKSNDDEKCSWGEIWRCLILIIFNFSRWLLTLSGTIFAFIIDTKNVDLILKGTATANPIYEVWTFIRDLFNMFFIMMLLFSAFCTIFRIESYNYKKILWKIVLMALLVNFSFPITRFIIDVFNILMYSLIKSSLFTSTGSTSASALVDIANNSALKEMLTSTNYPNNSTLLAATIMILMLAIVFLVIGLLLLVRVVVLAVLIIFSPVAFTGSFIPGISTYASKWWETLFKYSLFGPTMILGLIIAMKLMSGVGKALGGGALTAAGKQVATDANFVGYIAFLSLPIVLLWTVLSVAQKMGVAGSGMILGGAQKMMAGAALSEAKKFSGFNAVKKGYGDYKKERDARKEEARWKPGKRIGEGINNAQDRTAAWAADKVSKVPGAKTIRDDARKRLNKRKDEKNKKDIKEESEKHEGTMASTLHSHIKGMTPTAVKAMNDKRVKEAAGEVKQALSRGAEYEKEIERDLEKSSSAPVVIKAVITKGMDTGEIERLKQQERTTRESREKWIRDGKATLLDQARLVIKEAEGRGKI